MTHHLRIFCTILLFLSVSTAGAAPPIVEISDARPLFVFRAPDQGTLDTASYAELLVNTWYALPQSILDCSAYGFDLGAEDVDLVETGFLLDVLRGNGIAVSGTVAGGQRALSTETIADLFAANPNLVAIHANDIPLPTRTSYGGMRANEPSPELRWLTRTLDLCAAHGRFLSIEWNTADWLRILSAPEAEPVYHALRYYAPYVVIIHPMEPHTVLTATGALTGLWIEGVANHWGLSLSPEWYLSTDFVHPGQWGERPAGSHAPPSMYRAMVLAGAMGGSTVYRFEDSQDLWFGERGYQWAEAIAPTLKELLDLGVIPRRDLAARNMALAYQCGTEGDPASLSVILNDVNAVYGNGALERIVYGATAPRDHADLFPNRSENYIVPIISPYAGAEVTNSFGHVVPAGFNYTDDEWQRLLDSAPAPKAEGTATIVTVGRSVFVMHNRENAYEEQTYRIPNMPAPVRDLKARRTESGIELNWPFRENDFAYTVYRRVLPELTFEPIARNLDVRTYIDTMAPADETVAYALTALTNEPEPIQGSVNWGEYRVFSAAVSRIEEEVIVLPETEIAISSPVLVVSKDFQSEQSLWPAINGLSVEDTETAYEVATRLEMLKRAVAAEDAGYAADLFAREYMGEDGSNAAFVGRVFEAFFDQYDHCDLFLQPQDWFVESITEPRVTVTFYANLSGVDGSGSFPVLKEVTGTANVKFGKRDGDWRIISAEPPFPALADIAL